MGKILTREEAWELLKEYNKEPFHLRHGETVEGVMRYLAKELGYGDEVDFWGNVGLLHDLDFEQWPDQHCTKVQELMKEKDIDERMIHAVASHGYGICCDVAPGNGKGFVRGRRTDRSDRCGCPDASFQERKGYGTEIYQEKIQRQSLCCRLQPRHYQTGCRTAWLGIG